MERPDHQVDLAGDRRVARDGTRCGQLQRQQHRARMGRAQLSHDQLPRLELLLERALQENRRNRLARRRGSCGRTWAARLAAGLDALVAKRLHQQIAEKLFPRQRGADTPTVPRSAARGMPSTHSRNPSTMPASPNGPHNEEAMRAAVSVAVGRGATFSTGAVCADRRRISAPSRHPGRTGAPHVPDKSFRRLTRSSARASLSGTQPGARRTRSEPGGLRRGASGAVRP
jgi:hypothetical protein